MELSHARTRNVIEAYAHDFTPELTDLSCPSPTFDGAIRVGDAEVAPGFPTPGGSAELRGRIARLYERIEARDVLVTSGASEALVALAAALAERGRPIAVTAGAYPSFTEVARLAGVALVGEDAVAGASALLTSNPSVPDGRRIDLEGAIARAVAVGAVPVVDEVYRHIVLDGRPVRAAADLDPNAVSIGDLSKALGLGGLRIGWIATRNAAVREGAARWLRLLTGGPSVLSDAAACAALDRFEEQVAGHTRRAIENAGAVYEVLREAGWQFEPAELGLTVCACPPRPLPEGAVEELRRSGVFLLPTDSFGLAGGFRVGLLTAPATLRAALARLARVTGGVERLVVLGRTPAPGRGKTRLAVSLGVARTYELARAFFDDTCAMAEMGGRPSLLAHEGAAPKVGGFELAAQGDGDLGARIRRALAHGLRGAGRAVLIGTDTPDLPAAFIERAFRELEEADVVIGPSADGGFYLIGVRATHDAMFDGVEWSTRRVFAQTMANLERIGWRIAVLPEWEDVDDLESLMRLAARVRAAAPAVAPATRRALGRLVEGAPV